MSDPIEIGCPVPFSAYERVTLAHGGGGRIMHRLIDGLFVAAFDDPALREGHDGALVELAGPAAITTDAFTVRAALLPPAATSGASPCTARSTTSRCAARGRAT